MDLLEQLLLIATFPKLSLETFEPTSPKDRDYNCIAWAASETDQKWWPDKGGDGYWPDEAPREVTLPAFIAAFETLGFECCESEALEVAYDKIAIFIGATGKPTHAARQLPTGSWTSKLGDEEDIRHDDVRGVENHIYGTVANFMRRPQSS